MRYIVARHSASGNGAEVHILIIHGKETDKTTAYEEMVKHVHPVIAEQATEFYSPEDFLNKYSVYLPEYIVRAINENKDSVVYRSSAYF